MQFHNYIRTYTVYWTDGRLFAAHVIAIHGDAAIEVVAAANKVEPSKLGAYLFAQTKATILKA